MLNVLYSHNPNVTCQQEDTMLLIYDENMENVFVLGDIETKIWNAFECPSEISSVIDQLIVDYADTDSQEIHDDVSTFVESLLQQGLLLAGNE